MRLPPPLSTTGRALAAAALAAAATVVFAPSAFSQAPPVLLDVFPPGGAPGSEVEVELSGSDLDPVTALRFDAPGFSAAVKPPAPPAEEKPGEKKDDSKSEPATLRWIVRIAPEVFPGLYDLRAENAQGLSAPRAFHVSPLPVVHDRDPREGNAVDAAIETRIAGFVEEGWPERFRFKTDAPRRVVLECFGERVDSMLDGVLDVRDAQGRRIAASSDLIGLDPILAFDALPGEEYAIELRDFLNGGKYAYLLAITASPRAIFAFPPLAGAKASVIGFNLPGGRPMGGGNRADLLEEIETALPPPADLRGAPGLYRRSTSPLEDFLAWRLPQDAAGPQALALPEGEVGVEVEPNDDPPSAQAIAASGELWGRFERPDERDWFSFAAKKGQGVEIDLASARLGFPTDVVALVARREIQKRDGGKEETVIRELLSLEGRVPRFAEEDFVRQKLLVSRRDPRGSFEAPEDGEYLLCLRNRNRRGGPEAAYRLRLRAAEPDFELIAIHSDAYAGEALTVPRGGAAACDVFIERRGGFAGGVSLKAEGLPAGAVGHEVHVAPDEQHASLVFSAAADAAPWAGGVRIVGSAEVDGRPLIRPARAAVTIYGQRQRRHPFRFVQSRFIDAFPIAVRDAPLFAVEVEPRELTVAPGAKLKVEVKVTRREGFDGAVQIACQGLGEKAPPNDEGQRPAKSTLDKGKESQEIELQLRSQSPYGPRSILIHASAEVRLPDAGRKRDRRHRLSVAALPVTVRVVPPVALAPAPELGTEPRQVLPGESLEIPFTLSRQPGVGEVEVRLALPQGARGWSAEAVKLAADAASGAIRLRSSIEGGATRLEGLVLEARTQFAGRGFNEKTPLAFAVERDAAFRIHGVESARFGVLRVEIERHPRLLTAESALVTITAKTAGGKEAAAEARLAAEARRGGVLIDAPAALGAPSAGALFPLQIRLSVKTPQGTLSEEHRLERAGGS
jgi:hypothetical protein